MESNECSNMCSEERLNPQLAQTVSESDSARRNTYRKRPSLHSKEKEEYINKLVCLLFLRGTEFKDLYIGCNVDGAESFGDIIVKFVDECGDCRIFLLHVDIPLSNKDAFNFVDSDMCNMNFVFKQTNMITENFKSQSTLQNLGALENFEFIFYTSATISESNNLKCTNNYVHSVLNTGNSECFTYLFGDKAHTENATCFSELHLTKTFLKELTLMQNPSEITKKLEKFKENINTKEMIEKLEVLAKKPTQETVIELYDEVECMHCSEVDEQVLPKIRVYTGQADVDRINYLIRNEIFHLSSISEFGIHIMFNYILNEIEIWQKSCNHYLKNNSDKWQKFISKLETCNQIQKPYVEDISNHRIRFFVFSLKTIKSCILQFRVLNILATSHDISLTCLKVHQILENVATRKYLWISFTTLLDWKEEVFQMWFSESFQILVIEIVTSNDDFKNTVNEIAQILRMDARKYVIIISADTNKFTSCLKNIVFPDDYCELKDNFRFADLDDQSQEKILDSKVQFQGHPISIGSLIGSSNELKDSLKASVVSRLIRDGDAVVIGPPLNESNSSYVPRTLELLVELDVGIIKSIAETEVFVVSVTAVSELRKILENECIQSYSLGDQVNCESRLFCLESTTSNDEFLRICEHFPFKNIHHLIYKKGSLWWRESKGQTKYLKDYLICSENARHIWEVIERSKSSVYQPQSLLDSVEHHMVILGKSGVGKSSLLSALQKNTKTKEQLHWLIHLNFNNDIKLIVNTKKEDYDCEIIIQIMYSLLKVEHHGSEVEHILLRHDFEKRGNIIITCEGLDSVNPMYISKVVEFIHALDTMKIKNIWITSTFSMKSVLEKSFKIVVSEIHPLSSEEQIFLLHSLWEKTCARDNHKQLLYSEERIKNFSARLQGVFISNKASYLSLPLVCLMSAEIFETHLIEYLSSTSVDWLENIDIAQIYEKFIDQRRLHFHKNNVNTNIICEVHEEQEEFFLNRHMLCALFSLLDITELGLLNLLDIFENVSKLVEDIKRYGIIQSIVNKKPIFFHRTFAEYFCAMWFSKNIDKSREFLKRKLFDSNFKSVLQFFDYFLIKGHELHSAVLKNEDQAIKSLLAYGVDSSSTDKGGRTALHLAVVYSRPRVSTFPIKGLEGDSHDYITKLLVDHSINTKMIDNVLQWRPIQYAIELRKWDAMDLLLKEQVDFNDLDCLKEKSNDESFVQEGLQIGSEKGYFNLIEAFTCCGINISEYVIETKEGQFSLLHVAAKYGQLKLVRYLLSKRIKISVKDNKGISPLHLAASEGMIEVLVYLLQRGADLHCTDRNGNSPLNFAIFKNELNTIILLIEQYHSNINFQNKFGDAPLHHAVRVGDVTVIEYLLMKGAQMDIGNRDGNTPLHLAVWIGGLSAVKVLLEYGASVHICNKCGDTPLTQSAGGGNLEIVKLLVANGADVKKRNDNGNTALHWAARQNNERVVEFLLSKGADINAQNKYGNTALHRAVEHGCLDTTKFLINAGCNITIQNAAGYTAVKMRSRSKEVADCIACL
ncbi:hypothetical protein R5R35_007664 [Gryllus longicercus]|uniref:Uncharacterized protein n=1 Tax=Gryllus longicercus TaxID=2509291 RepID=A0AAN9Z731_9ORTH